MPSSVENKDSKLKFTPASYKVSPLLSKPAKVSPHWVHQFFAKHTDYRFWDQLGIGLSLLCTLHCLALPFGLMFLPLLAQYFLTHPVLHLIFALLIVPTGAYAFIKGYQNHSSLWVMILGLVGLSVLISAVLLFHVFKVKFPELPVVLFGSAALLVGHIVNLHKNRSCICPH
jgi:MerC mercury resistance protein